MSLLEVEDLRVTFPTEAGPFEAVRGVSFSLGRERLAIVGESGSGKTMTGRAILRLIPGAETFSRDAAPWMLPAIITVRITSICLSVRSFTLAFPRARRSRPPDASGAR